MTIGRLVEPTRVCHVNRNMSVGNETEIDEKKSLWLPIGTFWLCALLGTSAAGALFGIFAGPPGIVIGFFIAAVVGGPIHLAACLLTLFGPLVRFRQTTATLAGLLSGVFSVRAAMAENGTKPLVIAGVIGAVVTWAVTYWFLRETWLKKYRDQIFPTSNRFTLFDTFYFLTVVALISVVVAAVMRMES